MYYIYLFQNTINQKVYVGYTNNYIRRWREEKSIAFNEKSPYYNFLFPRAIRKYGWETFTCYIIEEFDNKEDALEAEIFWIEFFRSNVKVYGKSCGYNMCAGGVNPGKSLKGTKKPPRSAEYRANISISKMGDKNGMFGVKRSKEAQIKIDIALEKAPRRKNKFGITTKGVTFDTRKNKFFARASKEFGYQRIGYFKTEQEAAEVLENYKTKVRELSILDDNGKIIELILPEQISKE